MSQGFDIGRKLTIEECDFARSRNFDFVGRYISPLDKGMNSDEVAAILSRRLGILPFYELGGQGPWTYDEGQYEGKQARAGALALGMPLGLPITASIDAAVPPASLVPYLNGFYDALFGAYALGIYGDFDVVKESRQSFPAVTYFVQTYAWSAGGVYAPADVYQHANGVALRDGLVVDLLKGDLPKWRLA